MQSRVAQQPLSEVRRHVFGPLPRARSDRLGGPLERDHDQEAEATAARAERSQVIADERVQPGGCLIETSTGRVDAQLSTKLDQILATFQALLEGEPL